MQDAVGINDVEGAVIEGKGFRVALHGQAAVGAQKPELRGRRLGAGAGNVDGAHLGPVPREQGRMAAGAGADFALYGALTAFAAALPLALEEARRKRG